MHYLFKFHHCDEHSDDAIHKFPRTLSGLPRSGWSLAMTIMTIILLSNSATAQHANYPRNGVKAFLESCTGLHEERFEACKCIIKEFQSLMPFDQFTALISSPNVQRDGRVKTILGNCGRKHSNKGQ